MKEKHVSTKKSIVFHFSKPLRSLVMITLHAFTTRIIRMMKIDTYFLVYPQKEIFLLCRTLTRLWPFSS